MLASEDSHHPPVCPLRLHRPSLYVWTRQHPNIERLFGTIHWSLLPDQGGVETYSYNGPCKGSLCYMTSLPILPMCYCTTMNCVSDTGVRLGCCFCLNNCAR